MHLRPETAGHGHPQADALALRNGGNPALVRLLKRFGPLAESLGLLAESLGFSGWAATVESHWLKALDSLA